MNDLAKLVQFRIDNWDNCNIVDQNGEPWFVAKDLCEILDIKKDGHTFKSFPDNEKTYVVCARYSIPGTSTRSEVFSKHLTSAKPRARKTQKMLIINKEGVFRLILESRKPEAKQIRNQIIGILSEISKKGIMRASLPKTWPYGGKDLTWGEYIAKKEESFFRRHPGADFDEFLRSLPNR